MRRPCFSRGIRLQLQFKSVNSVGSQRTVVTFQKCRLQVKEVIQIHTSTFMVTKEQMRQLLCQLPTTRLMEPYTTGQLLWLTAVRFSVQVVGIFHQMESSPSSDFLRWRRM